MNFENAQKMISITESSKSSIGKDTKTDHFNASMIQITLYQSWELQGYNQKMGNTPTSR
jgi:hypothetical protein